MVAYHLLSMGGMLALMWGAAQRAKVKAPLVVSAVSVVLVCPILWYAVVVDAPAAMKMAQNTSSALIISLTALTLWFGTKRNWSDHALIWVLGLLAGFGFVRPLMTVFADALLGPVETGAIILTSIHVLVLATLLTLMALCLVASIIQDNMREEREEASTDTLSGLPNRGAFEQLTKSLFDQARLENRPVSVIVADIDHFKDVNDTWGHSAGDAIIKSFAQLIAGKIRSSDIAGRVGGEEFCVAVWDCEAAPALALAERIRQSTMKLRARDGEEEIAISASFGVAEWKSGMSYHDAFAQADKALYASKRSGRNRVSLASDKEPAERAADAQHLRDIRGGNVVSLAR